MDVHLFGLWFAFIGYEKAATHWAKAYNSNHRKSYSIITIIKRVLTDLWNTAILTSFFMDIRRRGDPFSVSTHGLTFSHTNLTTSTTV